MLAVWIIAVGKVGQKFWVEAQQEYQKRLSAYCKLQVIEIAEQRLSQSPSEKEIAAALSREGAQILQKMPSGAHTIALCVEGAQMDSVALSEKIARWQTEGVSRLCLVIGGSFGLAPEIKQRADFRLSLSKMTLPHGLARIFLLEQLYRAMNLQNGGKYHK